MPGKILSRTFLILNFSAKIKNIRTPEFKAVPIGSNRSGRLILIFEQAHSN
ncbi:hypothetical protein D1AOALGA4SA_6560 [Olavius algarvensis Delta 1 endosymbiont]|nr:hypothetical protein D1AOALGA4SA_6560 [Olavius algarvensis Delta 1 endosymbiont]